MCGLVGFLNSHYTSEQANNIIINMTKHLKHRGPDDNGVWLDHADNIALGHCRLSVIDLTLSGHQPMHSCDGRYAIVYNGEIYNFPILKKQLQQRNYCFSSTSDTEVILNLIIEYGIEQTLQLISGMFALAVWDKKEKVLHLARDRIGEKPLYYGVINNTLVFASELKALCLYPGFKYKIEPASLAFFLQYGYIEGPYSIYAGIYKLMPGSFLSISYNNIKQLPQLPPVKIYWSLTNSIQRTSQNKCYLSDTAAINYTDNLLNEIVKNHMISDVPIGVFLSGGIDSSLIAALVQVHSNNPIKTFTIGFYEQLYNEAHYAKAIASYLHTDHTEHYITSTEALAIIPNLPCIYDEPFADPSAIPTFLIAKLTKQQVSVCLTGDGGDEIFAGYRRYFLGQKIWDMMILLPYASRKILQKCLFFMTTRYGQYLERYLLSYYDKLYKLGCVIGSKTPASFYQLLLAKWPVSNNLLCNNANISISSYLHAEIEQLKLIEKMMVWDTLSYLPDNIMVKVDRAGMAVSLETRAPYLDHRLIEFIWSLPLYQKVRHSKGKWILRQVLAKYLPSHLFERPKMGFGIPLDSWLRGPLRGWAENLLSPKRITEQGLLHAAPIAEKWQQHISGKWNWQYQLWTILMFQAWLEQIQSK